VFGYLNISRWLLALFNVNSGIVSPRQIDQSNQSDQSDQSNQSDQKKQTKKNKKKKSTAKLLSGYTSIFTTVTKMIQCGRIIFYSWKMNCTAQISNFKLKKKIQKD